MLLTEIAQLLNARPANERVNVDIEIENAGASDLMSDVLAFTRPGSVLLTGLTSIQVIRTAEMLDLKAIIFVRNKRPDAHAVALAEEMGLPLFTSPFPLYEACGLLYKTGLPGSMSSSCDTYQHWQKVMGQQVPEQVTEEACEV